MVTISWLWSTVIWVAVKFKQSSTAVRLASASHAAAMTTASAMRDVSWSEAVCEILTPNSSREMTANNARYKMDACEAERLCPVEMTYDLYCVVLPTSPIIAHNVTSRPSRLRVAFCIVVPAITTIIASIMRAQTPLLLCVING